MPLHAAAPISGWLQHLPATCLSLSLDRWYRREISRRLGFTKCCKSFKWHESIIINSLTAKQYQPLESVLGVLLTVEGLQSRRRGRFPEGLFVARREKRGGPQLLHQAQDKPPQHCAPLVLPVAEVGRQAATCQPRSQARVRGGPRHLSAQGGLASTGTPRHQEAPRLPGRGAGVQAAPQLVQGPFPAIEAPAPEQAGATSVRWAAHLLRGFWHPGDESVHSTSHPMPLQTVSLWLLRKVPVDVVW